MESICLPLADNKLKTKPLRGLFFMKKISLLFLFLAFTIPYRSVPWPSFYMDGFALLSVIFFIFSNKSNQIYFSINKYTLFIFLFISMIIIQYLFRNDIFLQNVILGVSYLVFSFAAFNFLATSKNDDFFIDLIIVVIFASVVNVVFQLIQFFDAGDWWRNFILPLIGNRPYSNFGQPNQLGTFYVFSVVGVILLFEYKKIKLIELIFLTLLISCGIALTASRTALLSIILVFLLCGAFDRDRIRHGSYFLFVLLGVFTFYCFFSIFSLSREMVGQDVSSGRFDLWNMMFEASRQKIWGGWGFDNALNASFDFVDFYPGWYHQAIAQTHNLFFDFIIWFGFPIGVGLFSLFLYSVFDVFIKNKNSNKILIFYGAMPFLVHSMLEYPLHYFYMLILFSLTMGCLYNGNGPVVNISKYFYTLPVFVFCAILGFISIQYIQVKNIIDLQRRSIVLNGFIPDQDPIKVQMIDALQIHANLLKRSENYSNEDFENLERVIKKYPVAVSFKKLINHFDDEENCSSAKFWYEKSKIILGEIDFDNMNVNPLKCLNNNPSSPPASPSP